MGLWSTVKGWFNVGGVSVNITQVENPFPRDDTAMRGKFMLTTKSDKTILKVQTQFFMEETTGTGEEEKTSRTDLGEEDTSAYLVNLDFPFELAAGEEKEMSFFIHDINMEGLVGRMKEAGGMLGAVGKAASLAGKMKEKGICRYYVEVTADVKGTPFDPSDKVEIQVAPGKS